MKHTFVLLLAFAQAAVFAQVSVITPPHVRLPKEEAERNALLKSLNGFLTMADGPNKDNKWVDPDEKAETYVMLDEVQGIRYDRRTKDSTLFRPYLLNASQIANSDYLLQVAYTGIRADTPVTRANLLVVARRRGESFMFSSPLKMYTRHWKTKNTGSIVVHYPGELNEPKAREYAGYVAAYDKKLGNSINTDIYCTSDAVMLLHLIGVDYKSDYNGWSKGLFSASDEKRQVVLSGEDEKFGSFDPHDLWHARLSMKVPRRMVNRPVDEGCAYLYGGSWGYTWEHIYSEFKKQVASNRNTDWMAIKEKPVYVKTGEFDNAGDYIVNALLVEKIEREKGFAGVWELLNCGKAEPGNANYYAALQKLTGITKESYNSEIWKLVDGKK